MHLLRSALGATLCALACAFGCGSTGHDSGHPSSGGSSEGGSVGLGGSTSGGVSGSGSSGRGGSESGAAGASGGSESAGAAGASGGTTLGEAGASGGGGIAEGGAGGAPPSGPLQPVGTVPADKIDLLFVIDNSISMADKQQILKDAVPLLVQRLVTPVCVDAAGTPNGQLASASGVCSAGQPEFPPIRDFHIGVVTSSLGGHGGDLCGLTGVGASAHNDDKAHLLPSVRSGLSSWNASGFLAWDPEGRDTPPGASDPSAIVSDFQNMVTAAGEDGCGYEATLEAWYRFLIDPEPPSAVSVTNNVAQVTAPDALTLAQRQAFLRPDSLVGIVVLSDENDCSIMDTGQGFVAATSMLGGTAFRMPRATSACAADPNDPCCFSCGQAPPAACTDSTANANCQSNPTYTVADDNLNLRCWDQKRRFGIDLLYPLQRYVDGLSASEVVTREGNSVPNPLFQAPAGMTHRDPSQVFYLGIVGVPWQDVADDASLTSSTRLHYLSYAELEAAGRFPMLLGAAGARPSDGLMFETTSDRSTLGFGPHPLTGFALAPDTSTNPQANPINGHESLLTDNSDLQFACIFPLATPRDCSAAQADCDCSPGDAQYNRALCQPPGGGPAGTLQYYAKAYPGLRHIELIRELGKITNNTVAASICPKVLNSASPSTDANYGYNAGIAALIDRMQSALAPSCLAEPLTADANGAIACDVLEVTTGAASCSCDGPGHAAPSPAAASALRTRLESALYCGGAGQPSCDSLCVCELEQLPAASLASCQNDAAVAADLAGYCYLDAADNLGDPSLLASCPVDRKRRLRFVGANVPRAGSSTYVLCPLAR